VMSLHLVCQHVVQDRRRAERVGSAEQPELRAQPFGIKAGLQRGQVASFRPGGQRGAPAGRSGGGRGQDIGPRRCAPYRGEPPIRYRPPGQARRPGHA
jgi:hypothetical protein